jgi:hypothetical protein
MPKLEYSIEASNVINRFYGADVMLCVEGDDDVPFWEFLFMKFSNLSVKVRQVGGKPNLEPYIQEIFKGKLNSIVAMDADYSLFEKEIMHPNILKTYGYSIENTIISVESLKDVIRSIGKIPRGDMSIKECPKWIDDINSKIESLVIFDLENHIKGHGISIVGDNCSRFLKSKSSPKICEKKVSSFIEKLGFDISDEDVERIRNKVLEKYNNFTDIVRGHFLFSTALSFVTKTIKKTGSKVSVSKEAMFGALLLAFEKAFDGKHPHYAHYETLIVNVDIT